MSTFTLEYSGKTSWLKHEWLVGEHFTAADAYLFTVTNWAQHVNFDLSDLPAIQAFQARVAARPSVQAALKAEGLLKAA